MSIGWGAFGSVFSVGLVGTVALVGLFTLGIVGLSGQEAAEERGGSAPIARSGGYACFALCAAAVGYGIYLIAL